ncbi:hypothetical protein [Methylocapsa sp. S129]|uniref:hypothetical protein n=1 Tax=Methylocapsa sp. S129 TaxID=1641869 RepID=UPI00131B1399|nr:hypothetical protein [Methylocapsa sp. S129]
MIEIAPAARRQSPRHARRGSPKQQFELAEAARLLLGGFCAGGWASPHAEPVRDNFTLGQPGDPGEVWKMNRAALTPPIDLGAIPLSSARTAFKSSFLLFS